VHVTVRFSNGSGDPHAPDGERRDGRGMAIKFYLPDGSTTDIVAITIPVFFVRDPEEFLGFTRARRPDPDTGEPDMEKVGAFIGEHPATGAALQLILPSLVPPRSYATCAYNSLHAFRFEDASGEGRFARYRIEPDAGVETMPDEELEGASQDGDPVDDPTAAWPEERETVELGRIELTGLDTTRETGDDVLVFDPTRMTDGIECSDDPILHIRSDAYAVSVDRRSGVARQA
jgi:catalase